MHSDTHSDIYSEKAPLTEHATGQKPKFMKVPYAQSVHGESEIQAVTEVLRGQTGLGAKCRQFESETASIFGKQYGVMVNSGSSANSLAFALMGFEPGSEVITPVLTFATTVSPILQNGLVPVFVDVDLTSYQIDINKIVPAIGPKTKALMIPSLLGNLPNMDKLSKIASDHNLCFIEDSCDTLGGTYIGRPTGAFSDITTTSFFGSHIINCAGGGGMICVQGKWLYDRLRVLRGWGRQSSLFGEGLESEDINNRYATEVDGIPYDNKFLFSEIGHNFLPTEVMAAFGLAQLERLPDFKKRRSANFAKLQEFFAQYEEFFHLPTQFKEADSVWLAFPILLKDVVGAGTKSRMELRRDMAIYLETRGIQTRPIFTGNILRQPAFRNIPHRKASATFPNADYIMESGLLLGCHQGLNDEQIDHMTESVAEFIKEVLRA